MKININDISMVEVVKSEVAYIFSLIPSTTIIRPSLFGITKRKEYITPDMWKDRTFSDNNIYTREEFNRKFIMNYPPRLHAKYNLKDYEMIDNKQSPYKWNELDENQVMVKDYIKITLNGDNKNISTPKVIIIVFQNQMECNKAYEKLDEQFLRKNKFIQTEIFYNNNNYEIEK